MTSDRSSSESKRGFASMDEAKQREIASKGGKAAHEKGTAHEFTSEEARAAGKKGGEARGKGVSSATKVIAGTTIPGDTRP
jgi:general stress protein YciG